MIVLLNQNVDFVMQFLKKLMIIFVTVTIIVPLKSLLIRNEEKYEKLFI